MEESRQLRVALAATVSLHPAVRTAAQHAGFRRPFIEQFSGEDVRRSDGRWMWKTRRIDRRDDQYDEVVIDPESGEVVHERHQPLSQHTGYGSAKRRV